MSENNWYDVTGWYEPAGEKTAPAPSAKPAVKVKKGWTRARVIGLAVLVLALIAGTSLAFATPRDVVFPIIWDDGDGADFFDGSMPEDWSEYRDPATGLVPLGDMCISLERAKAQAEEFGHSLRREVGYLTIHSMLHLLGYDHLDEGKMKRHMRRREEAIAASIPNMTRD